MHCFPISLLRSTGDFIQSLRVYELESKLSTKYQVIGIGTRIGSTSNKLNYV